jgi:hypothetical protein
VRGSFAASHPTKFHAFCWQAANGEVWRAAPSKKSPFQLRWQKAAPKRMFAGACGPHDPCWRVSQQYLS